MALDQAKIGTGRHGTLVEYLIKRTDGRWFDLHRDRNAEALRPTTFASRVIDGWGDHRILVEGVEIAFSYEDPGIHVSFEGEISERLADQIVAEICDNVIRVTGNQARVLPI